MGDTDLTIENVVISNMGSAESWKSVFLYGEFLVASIAKLTARWKEARQVDLAKRLVDQTTEQERLFGRRRSWLRPCTGEHLVTNKRAVGQQLSFVQLTR